MLTLIEALGYRCLRDIRQPLKPFQVLVGPNASGKTTFFDVVGFLAAIVNDGIEAAVLQRSADPQDLVWRRTGSAFQLAVEAHVPDAVRTTLHNPEWDTIRYEVAIHVTNDPEFSSEQVIVFQRT